MAKPYVDPSQEFDDLNFTETEDGSLEALRLEDETQPESGDVEPVTSSVDWDQLLDQNLAETFLTDEFLEDLEETISVGLETDLESLSEHFSVIRKGTDLLGIKLEDSGPLGDWSCGASHPLIIENAIKFQANVVNELDTSDTMVKTRIVGKQGDDALNAKSLRIQEFMNYYIPEEMDQFFSESSKCALGTALFGTGFKKNFYDPNCGVIQSEYLRIDQVITNWETKSLAKAYRYTELKPSNNIEIITAMNNGVYRKIDFDDKNQSPDGDADTQTEYELFPIGEKLEEILGVSYECERLLGYHYLYLDVKEMMEASPAEEEQEIIDAQRGEKTEEVESLETYYDKQFLPFLVIQELYSGEILGVYANWNKGDTKYKAKEYITDYHFVRGFGFYSLGYIHVLGNFAKMLTSIMRSLVDAGTFANLPGGFKIRGTKIAGNAEVSPGEFIEVESAIQDITKAIMPLPFKEPSSVLSQMYSVLENRGQAFANATEGVVQGSTNYGPVGTTMALLDASSKLNTSIIKDFHRSRRREFKVISNLMKENLGPEYPYEIEGQQRTVFSADFDGAIAVLPVSDPNIPSQAQRLAMAQQKLQIAQQFPQVHNLREALKGVYKEMGDQNPEKLLPQAEQPQPLDPLSDFLAASQNKPIKAFPGQDHDAHISFKQSLMQNPEYQNSEYFIPVLQSLAANIREHMVLKTVERIQAMAPQSNPQNAMQAGQAAAAQAAAMQQLTQMAQLAALAQQQAQDPAMVLAQAQIEKVKNDAKRIDSQEIRDFAKLALDKQRLDNETKKLELDSTLTQDKIRADLIKSDQKTKADLLKATKSHQEARTQQAIDMLGKAAMEDGKNAHKERLTDKANSVKLTSTVNKKNTTTGKKEK